MKTIKSVTRNYPERAAMIRAIVDKVGKESLQDVASYGAAGGYSGFIYYSDTCAFFRKYKTEIMAMAEDLASDLGEDMLTMIAGFNCLKDSKLRPTEIMQAIEGRGEMADQVQNALSWFALEEVARSFED